MTSFEQNLRYFTLVWLNDDKFDSPSEIYSLETVLFEDCDRLKAVKIFCDPNECIGYIKDMENEPVVLIIAGRFARHLVPDIHDFPQLSTIYVHCKPENKSRNEEWTKLYKKVI